LIFVVFDKQIDVLTRKGDNINVEENSKDVVVVAEYNQEIRHSEDDEPLKTTQLKEQQQQQQQQQQQPQHMAPSTKHAYAKAKRMLTLVYFFFQISIPKRTPSGCRKS